MEGDEEQRPQEDTPKSNVTVRNLAGDIGEELQYTSSTINSRSADQRGGGLTS